MRVRNEQYLGVKLELSFVSTETGEPDTTGDWVEWLGRAGDYPNAAGWFLFPKTDWWTLSQQDLWANAEEFIAPGLYAYDWRRTPPDPSFTYSTTATIRRVGSKVPVKVRWDKVTYRNPDGEIARETEEYVLPGSTGVAEATFTVPDGSLGDCWTFVEHARIFVPMVSSY